MKRTAPVRRPSGMTVPRRLVLLGLPGSALLAACGQAGPGGPPSGASPGGAAPAAFRERAALVVRALRESGALEAYASGLVLREDRLRVEGFDTDELKRAFLAGTWTYGPSVTDEGGTGTVTFPDGASRTVRTLGARGSLEVVRRGLSGDCGGTRCTAVVTGATPTTVTVRTNRGPTRVPAWDCRVTGQTGPLLVVSVDPADLTELPDLGSTVPRDDTGLAAAHELRSVEGPVLTVALGRGSCDTGLTAYAREEADVVVVGGTVVRSDQVCDAMLHLDPRTVTLATPLGSRPVVDVVTGAFLALGQ